MSEPAVVPVTLRSAAADGAAPRALRPLRVLLFANSVAVGGAETQLVRLATGLAARGHQVAVAVLLDVPGWEDALADAGVELVRLHVWRRREAAGGLARAVAMARRWQPDAIIGFDFQSTMAARLVGAALVRPAVVSSIRNEYLGGGRLRPLLLRLTDPLATVTTTNSHHVAASLVQRGLARPERTRVVHNGIDVGTVRRRTDVRDRVRRHLGVAEDAFVWLTVAHLRPTKGLPTLFAAVERLALETGERPRLFVAGGGEQRAVLAAHPAAAAPDPLVTLLGIRDDVPDLLAAADGFVLASTAEGLPNAVMEAMAAGLPVVATDVGGLRELLDDGRLGRLVRPGDAAGLAAAMRSVMDLPDEERRRLGVAGRARIEHRFGLARMVETWEALLHDAIAVAGR